MDGSREVVGEDAMDIVQVIDQGEGVFVLRIDDAAGSNRLTPALIETLIAALDTLAKNPTLRVLLLEGSDDIYLHGDRADLNAAMTAGLYRRLLEFKATTVAAVRGRASGAGFLFAALCDHLVCHRDAECGFTLLDDGVVPAAAEARILSLRFGDVAARDLLYRLPMASASTRVQRGWSCRVEPADAVLAQAQVLAKALLAVDDMAQSLLRGQHRAPLLDALSDWVSVPSFVVAPVVDSEAMTLPDTGAALSLERPAPGVLLLRLNVGVVGAHAAVDALETAIAALEPATSGIHALVLATAHIDVLPADADKVLLAAARRLQSLVQHASLPIAIALPVDVSDRGWAIGQCFDAVVHAEEGVYSVAGLVRAAPAWTLTAACCFASRMGRDAAREIVLANDAYSGRSLKARFGAFDVVPQDRVEEQAIALASAWTAWPAGMIAAARCRAHAVKEMPDAWEAAPESAVAEPLPTASAVVQASVDSDGIVLVRMHDRDAKNLFTPALVQGLDDIFTQVAAHPACKAVVLTGFDRYFSSGGTRESLDAIQSGAARFTDAPVFLAALRCPLPVIACMQGHAVGGGMTLGLFADFALFAAESQYLNPYLRYGFTPGGGATLIVPEALGVDLGFEALCTAREFSGSELRARNSALAVFPRDEIMTHAMTLAQRIVRHPRAALIALKAALNQPVLERLDAVFAEEIAMHERSFVGRPEALARIDTHFSSAAPEPCQEKAAQEKTEQEKTAQEKTMPNKQEEITQASETVAAVAQRPDRGSIVAELRTSLAQELHLSEHEIGDGVPFVDLGLDSITGVTWVRKINARFGTDLPATRVYSHPTLTAMAAHVEEALPEVAASNSSLPNLVSLEVKTSSATSTGSAGMVASSPSVFAPPAVALSAPASFADEPLRESPEPNAWARVLEARAALTSWHDSAAGGHAAGRDAHMRGGAPAGTVEIAIVGMAGRFPHANDVETYWQNLAAGRLCIDEVPSERWDMQPYYQAGEPVPGKVNAKWMGCLPDYDCFDPLFFDISPKEAMSMDPQQRVFLQTCWHAIEHAGYNPRVFSGSRCGVFVGCGPGDYHLLSHDLQTTALGFTGNDTSILAARVSYALNLLGPCLSVETACSSSLVAIATACDNLANGACDAALAGGVGIIATPHLFLKMAHSGMLSPDGRCYTFDQRANGFVPGEAVGALLLKRLEDAERDGDTILGVIRGWGVNQDGRTNGITAPNPDAQARLQQDVHARFGIDPAGIQMVEAHGTGTRLGDPIEVEALKRAFAASAAPAESCALGSVKSNIGHCFTAAGVASVIKVLQSLRHATLPPTINYAQLNEHIDLRGSPFYVNDRLRPWPAPAAGHRAAAISGFGFGGTNAHLVIREYTAKTAPVAASTAADDAAVLKRWGALPVVLSARNPEQLDAQAKQLLDMVESRGRELSLVQLAYTLQMGREAMDERLGVLAGSMDEVAQLLRRHLSGEPAHGKLFRATARDFRAAMGFLIGDADMCNVVVDRLLEQRQSGRLLELWSRGLSVDWRRLYGDVTPRRVALPGYPFAKQRYWVEPSATSQIGGGEARLHPLLHRNVSTLREHAFASTFRANEAFLVRGDAGLDAVLPASAMLEIARAALSQARGGAATEGAATIGWRLTDIVWGEPWRVTDSASELRTVLTPVTDDHVEFELYSQVDGIDRVHCQGRAEAVVDVDKALPPVPAGAQVAIELSELRLGDGDLLLHPWLIEAVVAAALGMQGVSLSLPNIAPQTLASLWVSDVCRGRMTAWVGSEEDGGLSVALYSERGALCALWRGLHYVTADSVANVAASTTFASATSLIPVSAAAVVAAPAVPSRTELLRGLRESLARALYLQAADIANDKPFIELGLDSIIGVEWVNELNRTYDIRLVAARLYDYPCLDELATHLADILAENTPPAQFAPAAQPVSLSLPVSLPATASAPVAPRRSRTDLLRELRESLARALYLQPAQIANDKPFVELGLDSIIGVEWVNELNSTYGIRLVAARLYDYPCLDELATHLDAELARIAPVEVPPAVVADVTAMAHVALPLPRPPPRLERRSPKNRVAKPAVRSGSGRIAIVGMSGRYPQARDLGQFWSNLREGRDSIVEVPPSRWDVNTYYDPDPRKPDSIYCKWIGMLDEIESFDPLFFRISPAEAKNMDPQHRLFLEEGYRAFEHAGYARSTLSGSRCGVYAGIIGSEYASLVSNAADITGCNPAIGAARIAYFLNLKGPAVAIDTACSASLVAIHMACQGLLSHETDMALAGGVSVYLHPETYMGMCRAGMLSPDGRCHTFDDGANGFVPGEGVGAVVLKRLEDAERDNDTIYGVILGSGINQDGKTNGITAPSVKSQIELERSLYAAHDIHPDTIGYVEAHGTGTRLGDPIELEALSTVFAERTDKKRFCALGSVKSNIGHASGAAGVASVHKVLLSLQHRTLVPSINMTKENTLFDFEQSPFYVSRTTRDWDVAAGTLRRAAVSSFGFSGTNAHLVIEEYTGAPQAVSSRSASPLPVVLSARTSDQLRRRARDLLAFFDAERGTFLPDLASIAFTLLEGREALDERLALVVRSVEEIETGLKAYLDGASTQIPCFAGKLVRDEDGQPLTGVDAAGRANDASALAEAWVRGEPLTWAMLAQPQRPRRVALPTYPFAEKRYWVDAPAPTIVSAARASATVAAIPVAHPSVSDMPAQPVRLQAAPVQAVPITDATLSQLAQARTFRVDAAASNQARSADGMLSPTAQLALVRMVLAEVAATDAAWAFSDVVWGEPLRAAPHREIDISIFPLAVSGWAFEIHSSTLGAADEQVHAQGQAMVSAMPVCTPIDPVTLQSHTEAALRVDDDPMIESVHRGRCELLVRLRARADMPRSGTLLTARYEPLSAVLRAATWLAGHEAASTQKTAWPDAFGALHEIAGVCASDARWAWIRAAIDQPMGGTLVVDIDLCDAKGAVVLRVEGATYDRLTLAAPSAVVRAGAKAHLTSTTQVSATSASATSASATAAPATAAPTTSANGARPSIALAELS
jgi:acyl transferase domain-containing protein/enoyl-CoA hydratase/carnithine racemase/acyl carrier protein